MLDILCTGMMMMMMMMMVVVVMMTTTTTGVQSYSASGHLPISTGLSRR
jgi:hypothetical protein